MIHHYINLVCWRSMLDIYNPGRDIVWVDTYSLFKLVERHRSDVVYRPGTKALGEIGAGLGDNNTWFFLTAKPLTSLLHHSQYVLPYFIDKVTVPEDLAEILMNLSPQTRVGLGISSPKQNYLAVSLHALRPDLEYHCFGAALSQSVIFRAKTGLQQVLAGSGLEWLRFLINDPLRTWVKIVSTFKEIWLLRFRKDSRNIFKEFSTICAPALSVPNSE